MSSLRVRGGIKLSGEITPQGAKNEALQVICATLLSESDITISNIPDIIDVNKLIDILKNLGVKISELEKGKYSFNAKNIDLDYLNKGEFLNDAKSLRGSIMLVGPLLSRFGSASIPRPGGDKIGRRRLDTHFINLEKLGANLKYDSKSRTYSVNSENSLKGSAILLDEASVTGTANIIMAAVLADGVTSIYNAACEPYIQQLCLLLNNMGSKISGIGSNLLKIEGVDKLDVVNGVATTKTERIEPEKRGVTQQQRMEAEVEAARQLNLLIDRRDASGGAVYDDEARALEHKILKDRGVVTGDFDHDAYGPADERTYNPADYN